MASKDISETIKVFLRPRPQNINSTPFALYNESASNTPDTTKISGIVSFDRDNRSCIYYSAGTRTSKAFRAHRFFSPDVEQDTVFSETAQPILDSVLQGFCGSILAYGATGSGKTFTMRGGAGNCRGVIPRSIEYFLANKPANVRIWASFVQIYCEVITDLLPDTSSSPNTPNNSFQDLPALYLRERGGDGGVYIEGVARYKVEDQDDIQALLERGDQNRAMGCTNFNTHSSRSHAILLIHVLIPEGDVGDSMGAHREGRLMLVDLAGSERVYAAAGIGGGAEVSGAYKRAEEGISINLSVSSLGNVLQALAEKRKHIPYRDSKLTRLLQGHLGGNARTAIIVNIADTYTSSTANNSTVAVKNADGPVIAYPDTQGEILNSLRFAERAMRVEVVAKRGVVITQDYEALYKDTLDMLSKIENDTRAQQEAQFGLAKKELEDLVKRREEEIALLQKEIEGLRRDGSRMKAVKADKGVLKDDATVIPPVDVTSTDPAYWQRHIELLEQQHAREIQKLLQQKMKETTKLNEQVVGLETENQQLKRILHTEREERLKDMQGNRQKLERGLAQERYNESRLSELVSESSKMVSLIEDLRDEISKWKEEVERLEKEKEQMVSQEQVREMQSLFMDTIERLTLRVNNLEKGKAGASNTNSYAGASSSSSSNNGQGDNMYSQAYQTLQSNKKGPPLPLPPVSASAREGGAGIGVIGSDKASVRLEPGRIRPSSNGSHASGGGVGGRGSHILRDLPAVDLVANPFNGNNFRERLVNIMNLPGTYDYGLLMTFLRQAFADWKTRGENCFNEVKVPLQTAVGDILQQSLKCFPRLLAIALSEAHRVIGTLAASALGIVDKQFRLETEEMFTQDGAFYLQLRVRHGIAAWNEFLNQANPLTVENMLNGLQTYFVDGDIDYMQACLSD
eukprot:gene26191-31628_t